VNLHEDAQYLLVSRSVLNLVRSRKQRRRRRRKIVKRKAAAKQGTERST
jgi:hypothetical protein